MAIDHSELIDKAWKTHGLIAHNAALADSCLFEIFHHFAGCKREMSRAIFFTLDAIMGRIGLVKRVAKVAAADAKTLELISELGDVLKDAINHRNSVAHSFLLLHEGAFGLDDHIAIINPKQASPGRARVTEAGLLAAEKESFNHLKKVGKKFEALCQKLGIPHQVKI